MKKNILISLIILTLCFDYKAVYPNDKPELQGEIAWSKLYYFSLHPAFANSTDTIAKIFMSSFGRNSFFTERKDKNYSITTPVPQNGFAELALKPEIAMVHFDGTNKFDFSRERVFEGAAIQLGNSDYGSLCQVHTYFNGVNSGSMNLIEGGRLGSNYQISNFPKNYFATPVQNYILIVGVYDNTKVTFKMGGCTECLSKLENGDLLQFGQTIIRTLNDRDVWLIPSNGSPGYLTGSSVRANKPVAVFSGSVDATSESMNSSNYTIMQESPTIFWRLEYYLPVLNNQNDNQQLSIFSKHPNTTVYFDEEPKFITSNSGNDYTIAKLSNEETKNAIRIHSDSSINVVITEPGLSNSTKKSLPFLMQLITTNEFRPSTNFLIQNPDEEFINLIYKPDSLGNIPEHFVIGKLVDKQFEWKKLRDFSPDKGTRYKNTLENNTYYCSKNIKFDEPGTYLIKSKTDFGTYKYAYGAKTGYGYPIVFDLSFETPDSLYPSVTYTGDCEKGYSGTVTDEPILDPNNSSNLGLIFMNSDDSYNFKFSVTPFIAGTDSKTDWKLEVVHNMFNARAHLIFTDRVGNRKDTIIECKNETSIQDYDENKSIEIISKSGILKFKSETDYTIDEIEIYDLMGKLVLSKKANQMLNGYTIETTNFTHNVYIIKMLINGNWISKKVII
jgi:hypothetical protein